MLKSWVTPYHYANIPEEGVIWLGGWCFVLLNKGHNWWVGGSGRRSSSTKNTRSSGWATMVSVSILALNLKKIILDSVRWERKDFLRNFHFFPWHNLYSLLFVFFCLCKQNLLLINASRKTHGRQGLTVRLWYAHIMTFLG